MTFDTDLDSESLSKRKSALRQINCGIEHRKDRGSSARTVRKRYERWALKSLTALPDLKQCPNSWNYMPHEFIVGT